MSGNLQEHSWSESRNVKQFAPEIGTVAVKGKKLSQKEISKVEFFEAGLRNEIKKEETIDAAVLKIVRMALAAGFGPSFVKSQGADSMISTITRGIMADNTLRKQALFIIDRFAK